MKPCRPAFFNHAADVETKRHEGSAMNQFFSITNESGVYWQCGAGFVSRDPEAATKYDSESEANKVYLLNSFMRGPINVVPNLTPFRKKLPPPRVQPVRQPQPSQN